MPEPPTLYFKRGCSGCDVARKWLAQRGITVWEREMFREPLTAHEIVWLLDGRPVSEVLSTRTKQFAAHGLDKRPHSDEELLTHMEAEPRLIRRPLLRHGDTLLVGFNGDVWEKALASRVR